MRRRDTDWFIKTLAVALIAGVALFPALQSNWAPELVEEPEPVTPGEPLDEEQRTSQAAGRELAIDLFEDKALLLLLTAMLLLTALIGGIFLAREDSQDEQAAAGTASLKTSRGPEQTPLGAGVRRRRRDK